MSRSSNIFSVLPPGLPRRVASFAAVCSLILSGSVAGALSAPVANAAAPVQKLGKTKVVRIVMRTPKGVPASVRLVGKTDAVAVKPASGRSFTVRARLKLGNYRVKVDDVVVDGVTYSASKAPAKIAVSAKGEPKSVQIVLKRLRTVRVGVVALAPGTVTLGWKAPKGSRIVVRRAIGDVAPRNPGKGEAIEVRNGRVFDDGLTPGATYSYAVFAKPDVKKGVARDWTRGAVAVGVPSLDGTVPPFSLTPGAVVLTASDLVTVTASAGQITTTLPSGQDTPPLGAGFVLPASAAQPGGFVGTVAAISPDGRSVTLTAGGLADVFAYLDLQQAITETPIELTPLTNPVAARRAIKDYNAAVAAQPASTDKTGREVPRAAAKESCLNVSLGTDISQLRPVLRPKGHWNSGVKNKLGIPYAANFDMSVALELGFRADLETQLAVSCAMPFNRVVKQLAAYPVPINLVFDPTVEISASGAVKVQGAEATLTNGFWAKGQIGAGGYFASGLISDPHVGTPTVTGRSAALTITVGGSLTIGPGAGTRDVGVVAGVNGFINPFVAEVKTVGTSAADQPAGCASFQPRGEIGLGLEAKAWAGQFSWSATWHPDVLKQTFPYREPWYFPANCEQAPVTGGGDIQATLTWNSTADLDLHVIDPNGEEIYYSQPTSESGGALDIDANAGCETVMPHPTENVYWPGGSAPPGTYYVWVETYASCGDPDLTWHLVVKVRGNVVVDRTGADTSDWVLVTLPQ